GRPASSTSYPAATAGSTPWTTAGPRTSSPTPSVAPGRCPGSHCRPPRGDGEMKPAPLTTGIYWVDLPCPRCHALETVAVHLSANLTPHDQETPTLRLRAKSSAVDHQCGQGRMLATDELTLDVPESA